MYKVCSIFSQVLKLFSRGEFEKAVTLIFYSWRRQVSATC
jgi:hypothetical protein